MSKFRKVSLLFMLLLAIAVLSIPAAGFSDSSTVPPYQMGGTDLTNFASGADLATARIDFSKLTRNNVTVSFEPKEAQYQFNYNQSSGDISVRIPSIEKGKSYNVGSFTVTYREAVILSDGTKRNLIVRSGDIQIFSRKTSSSALTFPYNDMIALYNTAADYGRGPSVRGSSDMRRHAGIRMEGFNVSVDGTGDTDTLFFTATGINLYRNTLGGFIDLFESENNYYFSECVQITNGHASDIYLPRNFIGSTSNWNSALKSEGFIFVTTNDSDQIISGDPARTNYITGFALRGKANGLFTNMWTAASAGGSSDFYILNGGISCSITSSSGYYGKIETSYDGTLEGIEDPKRVLYGGRYVAGTDRVEVDEKRTYDVPFGKTVTYKMTPEDGYILDKLTVNNTTAIPEKHSDANGKPYYTYTFENIIAEDGNQTIHVTWQPAVDIAFKKIWDDDDPAKRQSITITPVSNGEAMPDRAYQMSESDKDTTDSSGKTWTHVFYSLPRYTGYDEKTNRGTEIPYTFTEAPDPVDGYLESIHSNFTISQSTKSEKYAASQHADVLNVRGFNEPPKDYMKYAGEYQITNVAKRPTSVVLEVAKKIEGREWQETDQFSFHPTQATLDPGKPIPGVEDPVVKYPKEGSDCRWSSQTDHSIVIGKTTIPLDWDLLKDNDGYHTLDDGTGNKIIGRELHINVSEIIPNPSLPGFIRYGNPHSAHIILKAQYDTNKRLTGELEASIYYGAEWRNDMDAASHPEAATFVNIYQPAPVNMLLTIHKLLNGVPAGDFSFTLTYKGHATETPADGVVHKVGESTVPLASGYTWTTAIKSGTFSETIQAFEFTKVGTYYFDLNEVEDNRKDKGYTFDTKTVRVTVKITDNYQQGKLEAEVTYGENAGPRDSNNSKYADNTGATFENTRVSEGKATIVATKKISGRAWKESDIFNFRLDPVDSSPVRIDPPSTFDHLDTSVSYSTENKEIHFNSLIFLLSDLKGETQKTFSYILSEKTDELPRGITPAADKTIQVRVTDVGTAQLKVEYKLEGDADWRQRLFPADLDVINTYTVSGSVTATLKATKEILDHTGAVVEDWKIGSEHDWTNSEFRFVLLSTFNDTPMPNGAKQRTDNDGKGKYIISEPATLEQKKTASFAAITYNKPGTYYYLIRECQATIPATGMPYVPGGEIYVDDALVYSGTAHSVRVEVEDNGKGGLREPKIYYGESTNHYDPAETTSTIPIFHNQEEGEAELLLGAKKVLNGHPLAGGMFNFELWELTLKAGVQSISATEVPWKYLNGDTATADKLAEKKLIDEGENFASGYVEKVLEYSLSDLGSADTKVIYYAGIEKDKGQSGYNYSKAVHLYKVTLNKATIGSGTDQKQIIYVSEVYITDSMLPGWSYTEKFDVPQDANSHRFVVPQGNYPVQTNTYSARGDATVPVQKVIVGRGWKSDDSFSFVLTGVNSAPIHYMDMDGTTIKDADKLEMIIGYTTPNYSQAFGLVYTEKDLEGATPSAGGTRQKEFQYTVHETCMEGEEDKNKDGGYKKDGITYANDQTVIIRVTDENNGSLKVEYKIDDAWVQFQDTLEFRNRYAPEGTKSATIFASKQLNGRAWRPEDSFEFKITPVSNTAGIAKEEMPLPKKDGSTCYKMTITGSTTSDTAIREGSFEPITFEKVGNYDYEIEEIEPASGLPGISYTKVRRKVTVKVQDNLSGGLTCTTEYDTADKTKTLFVFENSYYPAPAQVSFVGKKEVVGRELLPGNYSFLLYKTDGTFDVSEKTPISNSPAQANGDIKTGVETFSTAGEYYYVLKESIPAGAVAPPYILNGIKYDTHECRITVTVTDNPTTGKLEVTQIVYDNQSSVKDKAYFINTYLANGEAQVSVTKVLENIGWEGKRFTFKLTPGTDAPSPMKVKKADGTIEEKTELTAIAAADNQTALFDKLYFTQADIGKTYQYNLKEVLPSDAGESTTGIYQNIQYDETAYREDKAYPVLISITDNEQGDLNFRITYGESNQPSLSVTNTWKAVSFTGHKLWVDGFTTHTAESMSRDVTLALYRKVDGGTDTVVTGVTPEWSGSGKLFNFTYRNLPEYDDSGKKYTYSVQEASVSGTEYVTTYADEPATQNGTIINKKVGTTTITGTKVWPEGSGEHDNMQLPMELWRQAPNEVIEKVDWKKEGSTIVLIWSGNSYTFSELPKYNDRGYEYTYYAAEGHYPGFVPVYHDADDHLTDEYAPNNGKIVNIPEVSIQGKKIWADGKETVSHENASEVHLTLQRMIKDVPGSLEEMEDVEPAWVGDFYYFHDLPKYDDSIATHPEYTYMVTETKVEGYEEPVYAGADGKQPVYDDGTISFAYAPDGGTITNKRIPKEETPEPAPDPTARPASSNTFRFSFTKEWVGAAPQEISFMLYNPDGSAHPHRFNRKQISATAYVYECWLSTSGDYYVIEDSSKEYRAKYVNYGSVADVTDRVYNGGKIINTNVPKTGDQSQPEVWVIVTALGLIGIGLAIWKFRKPRK